MSADRTQKNRKHTKRAIRETNFRYSFCSFLPFKIKWTHAASAFCRFFFVVYFLVANFHIMVIASIVITWCLCHHFQILRQLQFSARHCPFYVALKKYAPSNVICKKHFICWYFSKTIFFASPKISEKKN